MTDYKTKITKAIFDISNCDLNFEKINSLLEIKDLTPTLKSKLKNESEYWLKRAGYLMNDIDVWLDLMVVDATNSMRQEINKLQKEIKYLQEMKK